MLRLPNLIVTDDLWLQIGTASVTAPRSDARLGIEPLPRLPDLSPEQPTVAGPAQGAEHTSGGSTVRVVSEHNNVPNAVSMRATSEGDGAEIACIRVRRAMPEAGTIPWGTN